MSRLMRCHRCGALFVSNGFPVLLRTWRLCPRWREPLLPTGEVPVADDGWLGSHLPELST
jgi:hypothetical protein